MDRQSRQTTAEAMHDTAEGLERSEAALHDAADRSPDPATARRLDALGDEVTRRAKDIEKRAARLRLSGTDSPGGIPQDL